MKSTFLTLLIVVSLSCFGQIDKGNERAKKDARHSITATNPNTAKIPR